MLLRRRTIEYTNNYQIISSLIISNRINAIRKQYDAFLEEDKKRKERNEYILGKLDNMRYRTAMVQLRPKSAIDSNREIYVKPSKQMKQSPINRDCLPLNIPKTDLIEKTLLQEISKKYILIPKNTPSFDSDYIQVTKLCAEDDWKSKYDILDQLKNDEKESKTSSPKGENYQSPNNIVQENTPYDFTDLNHEMNNSKYKQEPEKDWNNTPDLHRDGSINFSEYKHDKQNITTIVSHRAKKNLIKETKNKPNEEINEIKSDQIPLKEDHNEVSYKRNTEIHPSLIANLDNNEERRLERDDEYKNTNLKSNYPTQVENLVYEQYSPTQEMISKSDAENVINSNKGDAELLIINNDDSINKTSNDSFVLDHDKVQGVTEYPTEVMNVQDFTPNSDVVLQDGITINPQENNDTINTINYDPSYQYDSNSGTIAENMKNPVDSSGIEAFDAEQKESFYTEQSHENYVYNLNDEANVYHQNYIPQTENYQEHQDNVYYEGSEQVHSTEGADQVYSTEGADQVYSAEGADQVYAAEGTEQVYSTEVNEREETSQQYDPNYEQQYGAYEATQEEQGYEQQYVEPQEYVAQEYENMPQEYYQQQFEEQHNETQEAIEQQLDNEQEFVEKQNEYVEISNIEKPEDP
ncbi:uncharacterized protein LOC131847695 [Achroia grisella]|uniref:uncharacterized protein LOC131847695 n=1 Tax=Achroia grisella TaxID=688607 RepID=UPI0027D24244|nr:uncharacterized protein LOC131847695 [Achroia grisella]